MYAADGSYTATLTVTDDDGATTVATAIVNVSLAVVGFRAANSSNQNSSSGSVIVPPEVQSGDQLLLFVTTNTATTVSTPSGWSVLGSATAGAPDMVSMAFTRTADAATAGSTVEASIGGLSKVSTTLLA